MSALIAMLACGDDTAVPPAAADGGAADAAIDTPCVAHGECVESPEAERMKNIRCPWQAYCSAGTCRADCSPRCAPLRTDVNPCAEGSYCEAMSGLCRYALMGCTEAANCPQYLPPLPDGGVGAWTCEDGVCRYPGLTFD